MILASNFPPVTIGVAALLVGIVSLILALEVGAGAEIVTVPLLLAGLGVGALASQLGAVTVSSVPDEVSGEVGGLQTPQPISVPPSGPRWPARF